MLIEVAKMPENLYAEYPNAFWKRSQKLSDGVMVRRQNGESAVLNIVHPI